MKKLNSFLFVFIFFIQLQAQNSFFIGERGYYVPEIENSFLSYQPIFVRYHSVFLNPPISTNLSLGYKRDFGNRYFIDFMLDSFEFGNDELTVEEYPQYEHVRGFLKQYQLQVGYYILKKRHHKLGISTGGLYRKGASLVRLGFYPNINFIEAVTAVIQLKSFGIPIDIEYDFYPMKWFSIGIEAGGGIYFTEKQVFDRFAGELIYDDFKWNLYLGLRAGFHFGDPQFKFSRKKKD